MTASDERPDISVVVAAWHGAETLRASLHALALEPGSAALEILVCRGEALLPGGMPPEWLGGAREVVLPSGTSVPMLRAEGIRRARGVRVVLLEDHCPIRPGWLNALRSGVAASPTAVVGGPVGHGRSAGSLTSWAVYLQDYSPLSPPLPPGLGAMPTGCNISLPRALLGEIEPVWRDGVIETSLWVAIRDSAVPVVLLDAMAVEHRGEYRLGAVVVQSWHHGRLFGAWRDRQAGLGVRLFRAVAAPIVVPLIMARTLTRVSARRISIGRSMLAIPTLALLVGAWVVGEGWGALFGEGDSPAAWA